MQPKLNPVFARFRFSNEVQGNDSIDKFVTRFTLRARDCRYADKEDEMIRDRFVFGTSSSQIREKLINAGEKLTLDKVIQIAQNYEYCRKQMATMSMVDTDKQAVDAIRSQKQQSNHNRGSRKQTTKPSIQNNQCGNCGKVHGKNKKLSSIRKNM